MARTPKLPPGLYLRGGTYYGTWYEGGRRVRRSLGRDFGAALAAFQAKRDSSPSPSERGMTFAQAAALYLADVRDRHSDKPRTAVSARTGLGAPTRAFGDVPLQRLTEADWREFVRVRRTEVSAGTLARDARYVRACLRWAVNQRFLQELPFDPHVKSPTRKKGRFITKPQIKRLLECADERTCLARLSLNAADPSGKRPRPCSPGSQPGPRPRSPGSIGSGGREPAVGVSGARNARPRDRAPLGAAKRRIS